jgi:hypothetical protein
LQECQREAWKVHKNACEYKSVRFAGDMPIILMVPKQCTNAELATLANARALQLWPRSANGKTQLSRVRDRTGKTDRSKDGGIDPKNPHGRVDFKKIGDDECTLYVDWLSPTPDGVDVEKIPKYEEHESVASTKVHNDADEKAPSIAGARERHHPLTCPAKITSHQ